MNYNSNENIWITVTRRKKLNHWTLGILNININSYINVYKWLISTHSTCTYQTSIETYT